MHIDPSPSPSPTGAACNFDLKTWKNRCEAAINPGLQPDLTLPQITAAAELHVDGSMYCLRCGHDHENTLRINSLCMQPALSYVTLPSTLRYKQLLLLNRSPYIELGLSTRAVYNAG